MIVSFHPFFYGHKFRLYAGRDVVNDRDRALMGQASAVLLPPGRFPALYAQAVQDCGLVFPNYSCRYRYPGKIGDINLFRKYELPHPKTDCFSSLATCPDQYWQQISYPVIIKHSTGGEGRMVFEVHSPQEARQVLSRFSGMEKSGMSGFVVQEVIAARQRTLRVVVMHTHIYSYWRVQPDAHKLLHNVAQGGLIDHTSDPELQRRGRDLVRELCAQTGIDLAGVDVLFDHAQADTPRPLLLEINSFFAPSGLGGMDVYHDLLKKAVGDWLRDQGLPLPVKDFPDGM